MPSKRKAGPGGRRSAPGPHRAHAPFPFLIVFVDLCLIHDRTLKRDQWVRTREVFSAYRRWVSRMNKSGMINSRIFVTRFHLCSHTTLTCLQHSANWEFVYNFSLIAGAETGSRLHHCLQQAIVQCQAVSFSYVSYISRISFGVSAAD
jgi:hypothetical protein